LIPRSKHYPEKFWETLLKKGCSIGANTTIISGNTIGEYAFIGAGSVVTRNIPPHTVWYGNPARQKGFITKSGIIPDNNFLDKNGKRHELEE
jgi:acetyltransferase-like isoleucine patch superfamily enzyme